MKRILFSMLAIIAVYLSGYAQCTINPNLTQVGLYPPADSLDCIERFTNESRSIQFVTPATFDTLGFTLTIDSIQITSITGMPSGYNYACNPSSCTIIGGQSGCVNFSGTTTDAAGQYPLTVNVNAIVTIPGLGQQTFPTDLNALGITYYLEVIEQGAGCRTGLTVSISGTTNFCPGGSTTLTADVSNSSGTVSYMWSPNGEISQSVTASSADTYSVTVTDQNGSATASVDVTEDVLPVAGFTASVFGQNGLFTNTSTDATSYDWDFGDPGSGANNTSTAMNPSHAYSNTGSYTVSLTATNNCGSDNTSQSITISTLSPCTPDTVNRGPGVFPDPDNIPCVERGVDFSFVMQTQNFDTFSISVLGITADIIVDSTRIDSIGNFPCGLTWQSDKPVYLTGEKGCILVSGNTKEIVGQYPLGLYMTLTVSIPLLGQSFTQSGEITSLIAQLEGLSGQSLGLDLRYMSNVIEAGANCPARDTNSTLISSGDVCPALGVDIDGGTVICSGAATTLTATAKYETGSVTYAWSGGETTQSISASTAGTYSVTITDQSGTAASSVTVTTGQTPTAGFTATSNGAVATITANTSTGNPTSYSWNWGDNTAPVTGQIPPPHTYTSNNTFTITLTATNGCGSDQATQTVTTTGVGIQTIENNLEFEVYPNPSSGLFNVTLHDNDAKPVTLRVFDLSGKMIYSENVNDLSSLIQKQLDLSSMPKGVYTLHLSSEKGNGIQRLTIY